MSRQPPVYRNIGKRTGLDIKDGKLIRKNAQGFDVFEDYFTESEDEVSFSVELRKKFKKHAATGASLPVSKLTQPIRSMSPFVPSPSEADQSGTGSGTQESRDLSASSSSGLNRSGGSLGSITRLTCTMSSADDELPGGQTKKRLTYGADQRVSRGDGEVFAVPAVPQRRSLVAAASGDSGGGSRRVRSPTRRSCRLSAASPDASLAADSGDASRPPEAVGPVSPRVTAAGGGIALTRLRSGGDTRAVRSNRKSARSKSTGNMTTGGAGDEGGGEGGVIGDTEAISPTKQASPQTRPASAEKPPGGREEGAGEDVRQTGKQRKGASRRLDGKFSEAADEALAGGSPSGKRRRTGQLSQSPVGAAEGSTVSRRSGSRASLVESVGMDGLVELSARQSQARRSLSTRKSVSSRDDNSEGELLAQQSQTRRSVSARKSVSSRDGNSEAELLAQQSQTRRSLSARKSVSSRDDNSEGELLAQQSQPRRSLSARKSVSSRDDNSEGELLAQQSKTRRSLSARKSVSSRGDNSEGELLTQQSQTRRSLSARKSVSSRDDNSEGELLAQQSQTRRSLSARKSVSSRDDNSEGELLAQQSQTRRSLSARKSVSSRDDNSEGELLAQQSRTKRSLSARNSVSSRDDNYEDELSARQSPTARGVSPPESVSLSDEQSEIEMPAVRSTSKKTLPVRKSVTGSTVKKGLSPSDKSALPSLSRSSKQFSLEPLGSGLTTEETMCDVSERGSRGEEDEPMTGNGEDWEEDGRADVGSGTEVRSLRYTDRRSTAVMGGEVTRRSERSPGTGEQEEEEEDDDDFEVAPSEFLSFGRRLANRQSRGKTERNKYCDQSLGKSSRSVGLRSADKREAAEETSSHGGEGHTPNSQRDKGDTPRGWRGKGETPGGQRDKGDTPCGQKDKRETPRGQRDKGETPRGRGGTGETPRGQRDKGETPRGRGVTGGMPRSQAASKRKTEKRASLTGRRSAPSQSERRRSATSQRPSGGQRDAKRRRASRLSSAEDRRTEEDENSGGQADRSTEEEDGRRTAEDEDVESAPEESSRSQTSHERSGARTAQLGEDTPRTLDDDVESAPEERIGSRTSHESELGEDTPQTLSSGRKQRTTKRLSARFEEDDRGERSDAGRWKGIRDDVIKRMSLAIGRRSLSVNESSRSAVTPSSGQSKRRTVMRLEADNDLHLPDESSSPDADEETPVPRRRRSGPLVAGRRSVAAVAEQVGGLSPIDTRDQRGQRTQRRRTLHTPAGMPSANTPCVPPRSILKRKRSRMSDSRLPRFSTSSPLHYYEEVQSSTLPLVLDPPKVVRIVEPAPVDKNGPRRSRRTRVQPLDWFRNERILYKARKSGGFVVAGIISPLCSESQKRKGQRKGIRRGWRKKAPVTPRNLTMHTVPSHSFQDSDLTHIAVATPCGSGELNMECLRTRDSLRYYNRRGEAATDDDGLVLCKAFRSDAFSLGQLVLRSLQEKGTEYTRTDTMMFVIKRGKVAVTIHRTTTILETDDMFFIPPGNTYNIKNLREDEAKLWFFHLKG